ncbi:hypothetical protein MOO46_05985 [Apilactobacillus apisilvae]|uniref:Uncharacterized protein n=1 Tax=Apilactobacillus apisilvae TaxID=2923364 RepID=A0ABY4PH14_9LACO|nr:hypothetical protein [Apilactobacillus apisilvae]UQS84793.1 hypothetical protein MOO46_05985 [Apilactobacillus apisilvae]
MKFIDKISVNGLSMMTLSLFQQFTSVNYNYVIIAKSKHNKYHLIIKNMKQKNSKK